MARTKQATPIRREPSSEYASKHDRTTQRRELDVPNGMAEKDIAKANDQALSGSGKVSSAKEAGITTLIIDVAGIYASL